MALAACTRGPPTIVIDRILLDTPRELDAAAVDREAIRTGIEQRLRQERSVRFAPGARDATHLLAVDVGHVIEMPGDRDEVRPVEVALRPRRSTHEYSAVGRGPPLVDIRAAVLSGFDDAWRVIQRQRFLERADDQQLIVTLQHPDSRLRAFAVEQLAARRSKAACEPLIARLAAEPDPRIVLRVVGALVAIGDQRAAEPLIDLARRKDPAVVVQIVFALGSIGGPTAEGYLVTLAAGHPVEKVRKAAADALAEMQARRHAAAKPGRDGS